MEAKEVIRMRTECEQCHRIGYLQILGNYAKVRHYKGINKETNKSEFFYHQQSKDYVERTLKELEPNENFGTSNNGQCSSVQCRTGNTIEQKLNDLGLESKNGGRSSSLVRTLALRAKGRRFKSGPAHLLSGTGSKLDFGFVRCFAYFRCGNVFRIVLANIVGTKVGQQRMLSPW